MPELPEVETVVRTLRPHVLGRSIASVQYGGLGAKATARLLTGSKHEFQRNLVGFRIQNVSRFGKSILMHLERPPRDGQRAIFTVHLGMTGQLTCESTDRPAGKHTHVMIELNEPGLWIHYSDIRRFGRLRVGPSLPENLLDLGPEPLEIALAEFRSLLRTRRSMIKSALLDQRFLRGVGNIYADESLFRAGIHPAAIASRLGPKKAAALLDSIQGTLNEAIALGGSSISDYVDAEGQRGFFQTRHLVYQRTGEPCSQCGKSIQKMIVASRSTHFCPRCQKRRG